MSRLQQNSAQLISTREDPLNQIWYKSIHWQLLGKWVKYNVVVPFYLYVIVRHIIRVLTQYIEHFNCLKSHVGEQTT